MIFWFQNGWSCSNNPYFWSPFCFPLLNLQTKIYAWLTSMASNPDRNSGLLMHSLQEAVVERWQSWVTRNADNQGVSIRQGVFYPASPCLHPCGNMINYHPPFFVGHFLPENKWIMKYLLSLEWWKDWLICFQALKGESFNPVLSNNGNRGNSRKINN